MSTPMSIRFDPELLARLRRSAASRDTTASGLAQQLIDEGLRSQAFPGIVFRDGPGGRRAGLIAGPDIWEVISALRDSQTRGDEAIETVAVDFSVPTGRVRTALAYYGSFAEEVDAEIADNERAAIDALRSWESQQQLLA